MGLQGETGTRGATGATGATGRSGVTTTDGTVAGAELTTIEDKSAPLSGGADTVFYAYLPNSQAVESGDTVEFSMAVTPAGAVSLDGADYTAGTAGLYEVSFTVNSTDQDAEFALLVNGEEAPGSRYFAPNGQSVTGICIVYVGAPATIALKNVSAQSVTVGANQPDGAIASSILIKPLA